MTHPGASTTDKSEHGSNTADNRSSNRWRIWIDTGGTFTDCVGVSPAGERHRIKLLSSAALRGRIIETLSDLHLRIEAPWIESALSLAGASITICRSDTSPGVIQSIDTHNNLITLAPNSERLHAVARTGDLFEVSTGESAPILGARLITGTAPGDPLPLISMRLATTRGTNALLERDVAPVALFVTQGFADLLLIGDQRRPDLYTLNIRKTPPLYDRVIEVPGRLDSGGVMLRPLDLDDALEAARHALDQGVRNAAIALVHSWINSDHEHELARRLNLLGFDHVSVSSDLSPLITYLPRAQTAVVNAALAPVVGEHLKEVDNALESGRLHVMTSAGGLVKASSYRAVDSLLSGPAGGVVGAGEAARRSGLSRTIIFDMGGTSSDVARYDEGVERRFDITLGQAHLLTPALDIESVAAGGGSICAFEHDRPRVGPRSAGASPGPACYGQGGPLTLTDVNLLLGRLVPDRFELPIDMAGARRALDEALATLASPPADQRRQDELLEGFLTIADERMSGAIRRVCARKGDDPRRFALTAFGGAGPQHACAVAELLDISTVLIPAEASLLSAAGLGAASIERITHRQILQPLSCAHADIKQALSELEAQARSELEGEDIDEDSTERRLRWVDLRYTGQGQTIRIDVSDLGDLQGSFENRHRDIFGYIPQDREIEVVSVRVCLRRERTSPAIITEQAPSREAHTFRKARMRLDGSWRDVAVYDREALSPGERCNGPAIITERRSTTIVLEGWRCEIDAAGAIVLRRLEKPSARRGASTNRPAIVRHELIADRLSSIAQEMGELLRHTSISTNIKERLDFSCAVLDERGELVACAPHIPVHLGALGSCVRAVQKALQMEPGDVAVTNHPGFGGSHLPDVTVITPVFDEHSRLIGFVASRAHHAEIGGVRPGSMPPQARRLSDEGVILKPMPLYEQGHEHWGAIRAALESGEYPSRAIEDNMADLRAAVAAGRRGAAALRTLAEQEGLVALRDAAESIKAFSADRVLAALGRLGADERCAIEELDDGSKIHVRININATGAIIDFAGTSAEHPGSLNAPIAVVRSATAYVMRLLVDQPVPLNEGLLRPVELRIPPGCMLNPTFTDDPSISPAVSAGNVETSQRVVDAILHALGLAAASQGTMNNVLFGNSSFGFYETICGGAGATQTHAGADAVHTHMTNTAITDVEIIEHRCPVRIERFCIRRGSGGAGQRRGGDGIIREITMLEPMQLSVVTQRRTTKPNGMAGGEDGAPGAQRLLKASGGVIELGAIDGCDVAQGDRLIIETPGGGGWGKPT